MGFFKNAVFILLSLRALGAFAKGDTDPASEDGPDPRIPRSLAIGATVKFPDFEVFGVKLVNGRATRASLEFTNKEPEPVELEVVGGALRTLEPLPSGVHPSKAIIRNLTSTKYGVSIPAGSKQSVPYTFTTDMNPQDLQLQIMAIVRAGEGTAFQISLFNETVSIVEPPVSIFDPQIIFLYFFLLTAFVGTMYFVYKTWIVPLFPHARRGGKVTDRAKRSTAGSKKVGSPQDLSSPDADGLAVSSGASPRKTYDESWIPEHHINRPGTRRSKPATTSKSKP